MITSRRMLSRSLPMAALLLGASVCSHAVTPAVAVRPDLTTERISVISLREGRIVYFDEDRLQQVGGRGTFIQLRGIEADAPAEAAPAPAPQWAVHVSDGQRLAGRIDFTAGRDAIGVTHHRLGRVVVPLTDVLRCVYLDAAPAPAPAGLPARPQEDLLILTNGDRLTGFIEGIDTSPEHGQRIEIIPTGADQPIHLPLDRLGGMVLANPRRAVPPTLDLLVLHDGTRVLAGSLRIARGQARLIGSAFTSPGGDEADAPIIPLAEVARIDLGGTGVALRDLAGFGREVISGGAAYGVPMPPTADGDALRMHAPVGVAFGLPDTATRFAATAVLDLPAGLPKDRRALSGFQLVVRHGPDQSQTFTLSAQQPEAAINLPITDGVLELELVPGHAGPLLDRLRLNDALILVAAPVEPDE